MSVSTPRFLWTISMLCVAILFLCTSARAQPVVYVANAQSNNVSVINTATQTVVATVPVGSRPQMPAATPDGTLVYVANYGDNTISVISTATDRVLTTIPVGTNPQALVVTPNGALVYVTNATDNTVSVIGTASNSVVATVSMAPGGDTGPNAITVSPDGQNVYVVSSLTVSVLSTATNTITATISVPPAPRCCTDGSAVAISPNGANVYVGLGYGLIGVVNTSANQDVATISGPGTPGGVRFAGPNGIAIASDGTTGYATLNEFPQLAVFSTATNQVTATVPVGSVPYGIALSGSYAYVANFNDGTVSVINTDTDVVVTTIPVGAAPQFMAVVQPPTAPPLQCTVTDTSDDPSDTGSLRYCLNSPFSMIGFANTLNGQTVTVNPANGPLTITANKTIQGPGPNLLTISGGNAVQVFAILSGTVNISGLTIANGNADGSAGLGEGNGQTGGAINNNGALTVINTILTSNVAISQGGALYNDSHAVMTVIDSTVSFNVADWGGGIQNYGTLTVSGSTFIGNVARWGGGIFDAVTATVTNSTFSGNSATSCCGGNPLGGNAPSGGGAAIYVAALFSGAGTLTTSNSTLSGNTAVDGGGGISFSGQGTLTLVNDIIAGNTSATPGDDCDTCGTPSSFNLISTPGNILSPDLAPFGWYGGPTQTMIPLPGSSAICAGSPSLVPPGLTTDQRNFPRLNTSYPGYGVSSACLDLGAVQTNYQSVQFDQAGYAGKVGHVVSPAPILSVTENGQNLAGIPVTLDFSGSGASSGLGPVSTVAGIGATFASLSVNTPGTDSLSVTFPVVGAFTLSANASLTITPVQTTPTVTWLSPAAMTYGTPLGATQLDATASVPGTFAYSPAAGTVLAPGTSTLSVTFTPTDLTDYTTATASVSISVEYGVCLLYDQTKSVHSGAAYPVKLYLCDASGADVSAASIVLHATSIVGVSASSGDVEDTGNANPDADFRFDSTLGPSGGYIFNLSTNGVPSGTYALQFTVGTDPTLHSATFGVK